MNTNYLVQSFLSFYVFDNHYKEILFLKHADEIRYIQQMHIKPLLLRCKL